MIGIQAVPAQLDRASTDHDGGAETFLLVAPVPPDTAPPDTARSDAARSEAVRRFDAIRLGDMTMSAGHPEVRRAILALSLSIGVAAAFGFGLGRGIGGAIAELSLRSFFNTRQPLDFGEDRNYVDQNTDRALLQIAAIATARWLVATICGGLGATLGSVAAPRAAAMTGQQLVAIPPAQLIPAHVADLLDDAGARYGERGVARLRQAVEDAQRDVGQLHGTTQVRSGAAAFGLVNAVRGSALALTPVGTLPDIGISAGASLLAGAATGLAAGTFMAGRRLRVPDAGHVGDGPAPLVQVPLFEVSKAPPVPPRFTGTGVRNGLGNVGRGAADRIRLFVASTWLLGLLGLLVNVAAAATRREPLNWVHRAGKAVELGVGVGAAVGPYFRGLQPVVARDRARLEAQRARQASPQPDLPGRMAPRWRALRPPVGPLFGALSTGPTAGPLAGPGLARAGMPESPS